MSVLIRPARPEDAQAVSAVLTASITELCAADHGNDPAAIALWTKNKSVDGVAALLVQDGLSMFVGECDGRIGVVGATTAKGEIALNYVDPQMRFQGLSKALFAHMETDLVARGISEGRLKATQTALQFYKACGWKQVEAPMRGRFIDSVAMRKQLA